MPAFEGEWAAGRVPLRCVASSEGNHRDRSGNAAGIGSFVGLSSVRNGNGHYPCHTYPVRWGIRGPHACLQEVRLYERT